MVWKILLGLLLLIVAALFLPLRLRITLHGEQDPRVRLSAWFIPLFSSPKKEKSFQASDYSPRAVARREKKERRRAAAQARKAAKAKKKQAATSATGSKKGKKNLSSLVDQISTVTDLVGQLTGPALRYARVDLYSMKIVVATDDAAKTALLYGAVCPAAAFLLETLHNFTNLRIHHPNELSVIADFEATKLQVMLDLRIRLRLWHILAILWRGMLALVNRKQKKARTHNQP